MTDVNNMTQPVLNACNIGFEELMTILDMSPAGISKVKNRKILWVNAMLCNLLGYGPEELIGMDTRLFYASDSEYERAGRELYSQIDKSGSTFVETKLKHKTGNIFDCRIRASKLDKENPSSGEVIIITNISELKLLQIQLQQAQKMEAIGVLAGGISHDFNNILMAIQGHLSLMQIDLSATQKVENHTLQIGKLIKLAAELTGRLLGFARGGKYKLEIVDMNHLVSSCLKKFTASHSDIVPYEDYASDLYMVEADTSQIKQVLFNIFTNASQAMADEKKLTVQTANLLVDEDHKYHFKVMPGEYVKITVTDTGIGMDEKTMKRIFDPFFSTKKLDDKKGTGLGLSTVFGIIKNHNGYITVNSEPGKGSAFHIHLPARNRR